MLYYSFYDLLEKSCYFPFNISQFFEGLGVRPHEANSEDTINDENDLINVLWNEVVDRHNLLFPLFSSEDVFQPFKSEVVMSLYASLSYTTAECVVKTDIANSYIKVDPAAKANTETQSSVKASVNTHSRLIGSIPNVEITGQRVETNALKYFVPFGMPDKEFRVFNALDFYYYQEKCTIWPFYEANKFGMNLESLVKGYTYFFEKDTFIDRNEDNFSAYIFEELFQPIRLTHFISDFISIFGDLFYKYQEPARERVLRLLSPFYRLPLAVQKRDSIKYCNALKTYITAMEKGTEKEKSITKIVYSKELNSALFLSYCIFPLLQAVMARALHTSKEGDLKVMKNCLEQYISDNSADFLYYQEVKNHLKSLNELKYPLSPKLQQKGNGAATKIADPQDKKRNNKAIKTFEINLTHSFYNQPHIHDLIECSSMPNNGWSIEIYLQNLQNSIFTYFNYVASDQTYNYLHYLRMENKDDPLMR